LLFQHLDSRFRGNDKAKVFHTLLSRRGDIAFPLKVFNYLLTPVLDWIQVEVSSYCNASCIYCPHTVYKDAWYNRHISLKTFRQLKPAFKRTQLVFLQGWGEPFLNPDLFQMVSLAKSSGCRVGTSTNGTLLDRDTLVRIIEHQMDIVAFSLAGVAETNDAVRLGTSIQGVLNAVRMLNELKDKMRSSKPDVHIAYLLLHSGLDDVAKLPQLLGGFGVTQVVISTLDFVPTPEFAGETIAPDSIEEYSELCSLLKTVVESGRKRNIQIHYQIRYPERQGIVCSENIHRALFVSASGDVSPCVFTNLPVFGVSYPVNGEVRQYNPVNFGNINEQSLVSIWRQKEYRTFREAFHTNRLPTTCETCPKLCII